MLTRRDTHLPAILTYQHVPAGVHLAARKDRAIQNQNGTDLDQVNQRGAEQRMVFDNKYRGGHSARKEQADVSACAESIWAV